MPIWLRRAVASIGCRVDKRARPIDFAPTSTRSRAKFQSTRSRSAAETHKSSRPANDLKKRDVQPNRPSAIRGSSAHTRVSNSVGIERRPPSGAPSAGMPCIGTPAGAGSGAFTEPCPWSKALTISEMVNGASASASICGRRAPVGACQRSSAGQTWRSAGARTSSTVDRLVPPLLPTRCSAARRKPREIFSSVNDTSTKERSIPPCRSGQYGRTHSSSMRISTSSGLEMTVSRPRSVWGAVRTGLPSSAW
mmetsp:Transcript_28990/g.62369  ORF Transcript_28990/g.62369 Transcript_28990/m.62369 type:complete len:251 (-) Transcript_28990:443-1195(-)